MIDFMISDDAKKLIQNENELKEKLSDCFGELINAKVIDELSECAKYYTNNGNSNVARYSFRLKDICLPTLLFSYFSYAFRAMWLQAGVLFGAFILGLITFSFQFKTSLAINYFFVYFMISIISASTYRFFLLKEFFQKYEVMPVSGLRARKIKNIIIAIVVVIVLNLILAAIANLILTTVVMGASKALGGGSRFW